MPLVVGQDAHLVDRPAQEQCEDRVAGFVVGGRFVVWEFHAFTLPGVGGGTNAGLPLPL
jgi:hypothetical protein